MSRDEKQEKIIMKEISIEFPGVKALQKVDFEALSGRIQALVGANGAGKSTLMKVLSGAYTHFTGQIYLNDKEVHIRTPRDAKMLGIDIVYQEVDTALIPYLDVAENIMLDVLVNHMEKKTFLNWTSIHREAANILKRLGVQLNTHALVQELSLAHKQMVLIARAIAEERRFIILDEPTAPLSEKETEELFRVVRDLAFNNNVGVIFISHRLPELFEICQDITVMRDGKVVAHRTMEGLTTGEVVELMLGRKFEESYSKNGAVVGKELLQVKHLSDKDEKVKDVNLYVRSGEIVGIAGLVGAGKTELCKCMFGAMPVRTGEIWIKDKKVKLKSSLAAVQQGLALVPEERRKEGVLVEESVTNNLSAACLTKYSGIFGFLKPRLERKAARQMIEALGVKTPNEYQKVAYLSGGNQQKVAVGKWLMADAEVYIFDEPTKGVDVGAKREMFELISRLAESGKGLLYASCELAEILMITDRVYVMYDGQIVKEMVTSETDEKEILYYATGGC